MIESMVYPKVHMSYTGISAIQTEEKRMNEPMLLAFVKKHRWQFIGAIYLGKHRVVVGSVSSIVYRKINKAFPLHGAYDDGGQSIYR